MRLPADANGVRIDYLADIEPGVWVPPRIGPALLRSAVRRQLEGIEREITRRTRVLEAGSQDTGHPNEQQGGLKSQVQHFSRS